jgi:hypothetical protein
LVLLADAIAGYLRGEASLWDVAFAALSCIPGTKGLTTLAALRTAYRTGGLVQVGGHVLGAARAAVSEMARSLRIMAAERFIGPPPGSRSLLTWRGEGNLMLDGEDLKLVDDFVADAMRFEPGITRMMTRLVGDLPTSELVGLEARLKTFDSLARKVATIMTERPMSAADPLGKIRDSVRYTVMTAGDDFTAASATFTERLLDNGFEAVTYKNSFGNDGYQGINTTWQDSATGQVFEVQFHTPESFAAKTETHPLYEAERLPHTSPDRRAELRAMQNEMFDKVPHPPEAIQLDGPPGASMRPEAAPFTPDHVVGDYGRKPFQALAYAGVSMMPSDQCQETR